MSDFCRRHSSFFCPCAKPFLYRHTPQETLETWGFDDDEIETVLHLAAQPPPTGSETPEETLSERPWPNLMPDPGLLAWAHEKAGLDDRHSQNTLANVAADELRATGYVGEAVMHAWLEQHGIQHRWNGGLDDLPDFVIGNTPVAFRVCSTRSMLSKLNYVYIFEAQTHGPQQRFFGYVNRSTGRIFLVGASSLDRFMDKARRYEKGEELQQGFIVQHPMFVRTVASLTEPAVWLASVRDRVAA